VDRDAEVPLYPQSRETADLSIHRVRAEGLWVSQSDIVDSVIAVIEVKYANWRNADYDFTKRKSTIQDDLRKLGTLGPHCQEYLLLVDECRAMSPTSVDEVRRLSGQHGVTLLSNHPGLSTTPVPACPP
jgi:hypothetical protein